MANLADIAELAKAHQAHLLVDDAHGLGVLGANGRGSFEHCGLKPMENIDVLICPLGKAAGCAGAVVLGSDEIIEAITQLARPFIYTTGMSPAIAMAAQKSISIIAEDNQLRQRLMYLSEFFTQKAAEFNLPCFPTSTPIKPVIVRDAALAKSLEKKLLQRGFLVKAIRPPTVPPGQSRLRIVINVRHSEQDILVLLNHLAELLCT